MKHYVPIDTGKGWGVAYRNWRGEFVPVMECTTFETAYEQSSLLTKQALTEAVSAQLIAQLVTKGAAV